MSKLPNIVKSKSEKPLQALNLRMAKENSQQVRIEAIKRGLSRDEYVVLLYAFCKRDGFFDSVKPPKARDPNQAPLPPFNIRVPVDVAQSFRIDAVSVGLKHGELTMQMFVYGKKHGFVKWLETLEDNK